MIKKTMILTFILFTLGSNLMAQGSFDFDAANAGIEPDLTRVDVIKLIAIATKPLNLRGVSLANVDLGGLDLTGANLTGADLTNTLFISTILKGANLTDAYIDKADFSEADLTNVIGYKP